MAQMTPLEQAAYSLANPQVINPALDRGETGYTMDINDLMSMIFDEEASQLTVAEFIAECFWDENKWENKWERVQTDAYALWHETEKQFVPLNVVRYA